MSKQTTVESVPQEWPGAWGVYKRSAAIVRQNVWTILGLWVLYLLIDSGIGQLSRHHKDSPWQLVNLLLSVWFSITTVRLYLAGSRGEQLDPWTALGQGAKRYLPALGSTVLTVLISVISFVLLVVPAFFVVPRLTLALYYVMDQNQGPVEAIRSSWLATKGNVGKVYGLVGVSIVFVLLCLVLVGIYLLFIYQAATAVLYLYIRSQKAKATPTA